MNFHASHANRRKDISVDEKKEDKKERKKERKEGRKRQLVRVKEHIRSPRRESTLLKVEKRGREEKKKEEEDGKGSFLSTHDPRVDDVTSAVEKAMKRASSIVITQSNGTSSGRDRVSGLSRSTMKEMWRWCVWDRPSDRPVRETTRGFTILSTIIRQFTTSGTFRSRQEFTPEGLDSASASFLHRRCSPEPRQSSPHALWMPLHRCFHLLEIFWDGLRGEGMIHPLILRATDKRRAISAQLRHSAASRAMPGAPF